MLASYAPLPPTALEIQILQLPRRTMLLQHPPPSVEGCCTPKLSLNPLKISQGGPSLVMLCRPRRSARRESRFDPPLAQSGVATPCSVRVGTRRRPLRQQKKKRKKERTKKKESSVQCRCRGFSWGPRHRLQSCTSPDTL